MSSPSHIELILTEGEEVIQKADEVADRPSLHLSSRQRGIRTRQALIAA
jgi:large subunit ribosomal protein L17e